MIIEIRAYYEDGTEILGNLDGQALRTCKDYRRLSIYKAIKSGQFKRPAQWRVFSKPSTYSDDLSLLEII